MRAKLPTTPIRVLPLKQLPSLGYRASSPLCASCSALRLVTTLPPFLKPHRTLTTSRPNLSSKRGGKPSSKRTVPLNAAKTSDLDPFDFSDYDATVSRAHEQLKNELARVKEGGRDPEIIEGVRVKLRDGNDGSGKGVGKDGRKERGKERGKEKGGSVARVGDIASVVRRGRNLAVMVGEKDHLKPLLTALSTTPTPLSPTPSTTDPLTLLIPLPPPTASSRHEASSLAHKKGEEALFALREARGAQRKKLRAMELGKQVGPDEGRRAERELERRNEAAVGEAKKIVESCRKGLEAG